MKIKKQLGVLGKMKIAIHNSQFSYHLGGTERAIYAQIKNLLKIDKNIEITLLTSKPKNESIFLKNIKNLQSKNFKIELFDISDIEINTQQGSNSSYRWHLEAVQFGLKTCKFYKENNFDFVVVHFSTDLIFIPKNCKKVLNIHGTPLDYSPIDENCFDQATHIIFTTQDIRNKVSEMYPLIKSKPGKVIYLGTPLLFNSLPTNLERKNDILFIGRLIKIKGVEILISAIEKSLFSSTLNVCIVGTGPEEDNLKELVKKYDLEKNIKFISNISEENLSKLYLDSKIAIFPSYKKEGILLSMLEAAAHGCGLIVSDCCGMPEFIENNRNGLLFEPQNIQDLTNKIDFMIKNNEKRIELGSSALESIKNYWNDLERTKELYGFYQEIKND